MISYVKLLPVFPCGVRYEHGREKKNGFWRWNKRWLAWVPLGRCPYCKRPQAWQIRYDDSYIVGFGWIRFKVSCVNPECARQIGLYVDKKGVVIEKV